MLITCKELHWSRLCNVVVLGFAFSPPSVFGRDRLLSKRMIYCKALMLQLSNIQNNTQGRVGPEKRGGSEISGVGSMRGS